MRNLALWFLLPTATWTLGCRDDDATTGNTSPAVPSVSPRPAIPQVTPPPDLGKPPADATKLASGVLLKKRFATSGEQPRSDETVLVRYTAWRQRSGDTFFTTTGRDQPIAIDLGHAAAAFREALPLLHKGEKAMMWLPPNPGTPEPVAYEVELVDVLTKPSGAHSGGQAAASDAQRAASLEFHTSH
jgi:hypothetical protein